MQLPEMKERLSLLGMEPKGGTPEQFGEFMLADWAVWDKVVKAAGIRPE